LKRFWISQKESPVILSETGHKELKSPPGIRLMPEKARETWGCGQMWLFYNGKGFR
jgi:hypothetical protein